jgi:hypothetical protein
MLIIGLHVFEHFFAANRPGSVKYYVTLGIAFASSLYMSIHGKGMIRRDLGHRGGRNIEVTPLQAILVILVMVSCGIYLAWIMI